MTAPPTGNKTIRFTEAAEVDYLDGQGLRKYAEGSTHTMRSDKADRWVRRSKAVDVTSREVADVVGPAVLRKDDDPPRVVAVPPAITVQVAQEAPQHGNLVAGATAVAGADGGGDGQRAVNVGGRGRGGSRG